MSDGVPDLGKEEICGVQSPEKHQIKNCHCHLAMIAPISAVSTRRHLRSAGQGDRDLVVPRTRTVGFGPRSFSVAGPSLWNTLPSDMKLSSLSIAQFCSQLKTVMFVHSYLLDLRET